MTFAASFCSAVPLALALALTACSPASASRDQVRAVGSSTVYPFAKAVAAALAARSPGLKAPIIEATGTGAGMKLFCAGIGAPFPDIEDASRRMKLGEWDDCRRHGVDAVTEIEVGLDGIALAHARSGPTFRLTTHAVWRALAKAPDGHPNRARTWNEIDPALPALPILVYGPPTTSGTRDAFKELVLIRGCDAEPAIRALRSRDPAAHEARCTALREDGAYVDAGENGNLTVQKLIANPRAIGIFGWSYAAENADRIEGLALDGVAPSYASIASFAYPGARPLYLYVKPAHVRAVPGLADYLIQWTRMWGPDGALAHRGLVIAPPEVLARSVAAVRDLPTLTRAELATGAVPVGTH